MHCSVVWSILQPAGGCLQWMESLCSFTLWSFCTQGISMTGFGVTACDPNKPCLATHSAEVNYNSQMNSEKLKERSSAGHTGNRDKETTGTLNLCRYHHLQGPEEGVWAEIWTFKQSEPNLGVVPLTMDSSTSSLLKGQLAVFSLPGLGFKLFLLFSSPSMRFSEGCVCGDSSFVKSVVSIVW